MFPTHLLRWTGGITERGFDKSEVRLCTSEQGCHLRYISQSFFDILQAMQDLSKHVTAAKQLWYRVQGRTHGREHTLRFLANKLWNQLGVLQEVITLYA